MRRFWGWTSVATGALLVAMAATLPTSLGFPLWHYNASYAAIALAALASWPLLRHRRAATLAMAFAGIPAIVTGAVMLYSKDLPRKEWITWWHSATSAVLLAAFLVHWLHNRTRLWDFTRRLARRDRAPGALLALAWLALAAGAVWTWVLPEARALFRSENYLYFSSWAVLVAVVIAYGAWLAYRAPALRERLASSAHRNAARAVVDVSLFLAHWGALGTGLALVWLAGPLRAGDLKYVSKWWHTATSALFLALVVLHIGFNARFLAAHARRVDADLAR